MSFLHIAFRAFIIDILGQMVPCNNFKVRGTREIIYFCHSVVSTVCRICYFPVTMALQALRSVYQVAMWLRIGILLVAVVTTVLDRKESCRKEMAQLNLKYERNRGGTRDRAGHTRVDLGVNTY